MGDAKNIRYRVTALYYRFSSEVEVDRFDRAAPLSGALGGFSFELADGTLKAVPSEEFHDRQDARKALEPYLRDWEQAAFLAPGIYRIHFEYERSDVEEVDPQPGRLVIFPETIASGFAMGTPTISRENLQYPPPDASYRRTPLTDRLLERLRRVRDRQAELPAVAYLVLSAIEEEFGATRHNRKLAAVALSIDNDVLDCLGALSSRADPAIGRKAKGDATPLTPAELSWLDAVVARLIQRIGEHAGGGSLSQITLADLPALAQRDGAQDRLVDHQPGAPSA